VPFRHPLLLDSPHRAVAADVWGLLVTIRDLFACTGAWKTIFTEVDDIRWASIRGSKVHAQIYTY
jgi:hypothetical protein